MNKHDEKYIIGTPLENIIWEPYENNVCEWEQDTDGTWYTDCSELYLEDNVINIKHCPYCGLAIEIMNEEYKEYNND